MIKQNDTEYYAMEKKYYAIEETAPWNFIRPKLSPGKDTYVATIYSDKGGPIVSLCHEDKDKLSFICGFIVNSVNTANNHVHKVANIISKYVEVVVTQELKKKDTGLR